MISRKYSFLLINQTHKQELLDHELQLIRNDVDRLDLVMRNKSM